MSQMKYDQRGVSASKSEVHAAIAKLDKGLYPRAFCKVLPDVLGQDEDWCNVMHADGAGTKSSLAYAYWRETGDLSVWKNIAQDALVMNLDDMLCVGIHTGFLLSSTIGRNKNLIPGEVLKALIEGTQELLEQLRAYGVDIYNSGGETADVGDLVRTLILDNTLTARVRRRDIITNEHIQPGDVIVGLASFGQAAYETTYNSGMGSNGLTSARHEVFGKTVAQKYPETFDPALPESLAYIGAYQLTDPIGPAQYADLPQETTVGKLVLAPTRTYAPIMRLILQAHRAQIHGLVHCTGGGQAKALHFVEKVHLVKNQLFPTPPLFRLIQNQSQTDWAEMYRVFNMGHRLEIYTDLKTAEALLPLAASLKVEAKIIGYVEPAEQARVSIQSEHGHFEYLG
ncbi:MAG: AIR synthase-related protein [Microscillaceae bacterium]